MSATATFIYILFDTVVLTSSISFGALLPEAALGNNSALRVCVVQNSSSHVDRGFLCWCCHVAAQPVAVAGPFPFLPIQCPHSPACSVLYGEVAHSPLRHPVAMDHQVCTQGGSAVAAAAQRR